MAIDYRISKVTIRGFRGIDALDLDVEAGVPSVLIGSNNAGKSTVLDAIALALNSGGFQKWSPSESDFFCDTTGSRAQDFQIQVHFHSDHQFGLPAVKGVGKAVLVHGIQVRGSTAKNGWMTHKRTLLDEDGSPITMSTRSPLSKAEKETFADHAIGYRPVYARVDDIREHAADVWLFKPKDISAALYVWKNGPLKRLSNFLAEKFLRETWTYKSPEGREWEMPTTVNKAHDFLRATTEAFPFWTGDMKPRLERIFERYVGANAKIELRPDILTIQEWLSQQLQVSLAMDEGCASTPLENMGDGWQSAIRLAALEALCEYPDLVRERTVLLLEEPETHLHPHLRRKMRKVLGELSSKGWTVIYTTHSPEMVSLDEPQVITRLVRHKGSIKKGSVDTRAIEDSAKLQSKLDERGAHDFLFGTGAVFCEGKNDSFALRLALDKKLVDYDGRAISINQCGSVTAMPAFTRIATTLGIRWCAATDEDVLEDGTIKPLTAAARGEMETLRRDTDILVEWPGDLERSLKVSSGKARPEVAIQRLGDEKWETAYPDFSQTMTKIIDWMAS